MSEIAFAGAARQAEMLRAKEVSSRELTELYLERIGRLDERLNSYRVVWADGALATADEADRRIAAGVEAPLLGVPIAIKDTLDVEGDVTMLGTSGFDAPAPKDSVLVTRLRDAGAVLLGKTNLPELAMHGFTESQTFGATRNPWDTERTTGGSSGGSGAAVAAGLAALAHASDGAGSIRYPAANCGLFGLKPQRDRVPIAAANWYGLTVNGCVSRTVADTALFLDAATSGLVLVRQRAAGSGAELRRGGGLAAGDSARGGQREAAAGARSAAAPRRLTADGRGDGRAARPPRPLGGVAGPRLGEVGNQIAARYLGGIAEDVDAVPHGDRLEPLTKGYRRLARVLAPSWAVRRALRLESADRERINRVFDHADVLLTPMSAGPAVPIGYFRDRRPFSCLMAESRYHPYAVAWNHTGQPAASVPAGLSSEGLPLSVQLAAPPNGEETLLSLAAQLEAERPWAERRPGVA